MVSPHAKRQTVRYLVDEYPMSERRACQVVDMPRSTARYQPQGQADEAQTVEAVRDFAYRFPQHGYRHITALMQREGYEINHKRVERIWRQEGLQLQRRKSVKRRFGERGDVKKRAEYPNHVWSYDFTEDRTERGQRMRVLAVMDEYTRECLMTFAAKRISSKRVIDILNWLFATRGVPHHIRSDNGPEFVAHRVQKWLADRGSQTLYITPGSPWENPFIERFIGTLKAECLDRYLFDRVSEAQVILDHYVDEYNRFRPHSSLGYLTPKEFHHQWIGQVTLTPTGT
ncbi:MAG: IS3 family transposase [Anaerolineae bacterium]|nr:IS3 family transposase [Anaerolineae bacterium]